MANRIGIHSLVWVGSWSAEDAETAVRSTAETGYDLVELAAMDPESFDVPMTRKLLEQYGVSAAVSLGLDDETDVSSDDDAVVTAGRARLDAALDLVHDLGGDYLGGVIFSKLGRYTAPVTARGRANSMASIARLADRAQTYGITLGLEFCNRYETNVLNTTAETLHYISELDKANVVAHLDTYHMNIEETSFEGAVTAAADAGKLGYVHVGESHRGQLGTGSVPWAEFFAGLRRVDYQGTITFESFSSEVVHPSLSSALSIWRNLWVDSRELATGAREFIRANYGS
jgi:D-psicose/D-tagatose/L-ribulose 3-epimerase